MCMSIKSILIVILYSCYSSICAASVTTKRDSLLTILQIKDPNLKSKKLILDIRYYFGDIPTHQLKTAKDQLLQLLQTHDVRNREALTAFVETMYQMRSKHYNEVEQALISAISLAHKNDDHYLLYACFTQLAFLQTIKGNTIEAVSSFRLARKEALTLNDRYLQAILNINISDIYYKNNLYGQSLLYLDEAQRFVNQQPSANAMLQILVWCNKAENYFRLQKADSLAHYSRMLAKAPKITNRLYAFQKRTDYYQVLLQHNYRQAVSLIQAARADPAFVFEASDELTLADAYFKAGLTDSAQYIAQRLLAGKAQENHPEIKLHLYEILGLIEAAREDHKQAVLQYQLALGEAKEQIGRLTQVDTISSQIRADEIEGAYIRKEEGYKRTRLWLVFTAVSATLIIGIGMMLYRNIRQKRHYEQLFFQFKKDELSFINSHEVRRHLSNILGIIEIIEHSEDKQAAYVQSEVHLLSAALQLDVAIKSISAKLEELDVQRPPVL